MYLLTRLPSNFYLHFHCPFNKAHLKWIFLVPSWSFAALQERNKAHSFSKKNSYGLGKWFLVDCRVTLVVTFAILPENLGRWWGSMNGTLSLLFIQFGIFTRLSLEPCKLFSFNLMVYIWSKICEFYNCAEEISQALKPLSYNKSKCTNQIKSKQITQNFNWLYVKIDCQ